MSNLTENLFLFAIFFIGTICVGVSKGQTILNQAYLRAQYPSYASTTSMDFKSHNIIHVDHFTFTGANAVQSINLANNSIPVISQAFNQYLFNIVYVSSTWAPSAHFTNLLSIDLSYNKIIHIDINSFLAAFCETLDLSYNSLSKLHANQLFTPYGSYPNPIKIKYLKLNNNKLSDISGLFSYGSTLYPRLTHVYLQSNLITRIEATTFTNVLSMTHLYLNDNQITSIDGLAFKGLVNLRQVYIYNNPVANFGGGITTGILTLLQLCGPANTQCLICFSTTCTKSENELALNPKRLEKN
jgi:Leucine-rich repeat (LRR) protein